MSPGDLLPFAALPILAIAAGRDIAVRRVPDRAALAVAAAGLAARVLSDDVLPSLLVMLAVFIGLFAGWKRGWLGGGDVKLLTACTTLVPAVAVPGLFAAVSLSGGVLALGYLAARRLPALHRRLGDRSALGRIYLAERWRMRRGASLPYACAIAAGCIIAVSTAKPML